jgi:chromate transport protein ChrA
LRGRAPRGTLVRAAEEGQAMLNATERKALTLSAFTAACICFAPGEIISGGFLLVASLLLWRWDQRLLRREEAEQAPAHEA